MLNNFYVTLSSIFLLLGISISTHKPLKCYSDSLKIYKTKFDSLSNDDFYPNIDYYKHDILLDIIEKSNNFSFDSSKTIKGFEDRFVIYSNNINKIKTIFVSFSYNSIYCFQNFDNKWNIIDSMNGKVETQIAYSFHEEDINGDDLMDVFCVNGLRTFHGNAKTILFKSDSKEIFHYRNDIKEYHLKYDKENNRVISDERFGSVNPEIKRIFIWQNDSLKLIEKVETEFDYNLKENYTKHYKLLNDSLILIKKEKDINYKIFNKSLFESQR